MAFQECHLCESLLRSATASQLSTTSVTGGKYPVMITSVPCRQTLWLSEPGWKWMLHKYSLIISSSILDVEQLALSLTKTDQELVMELTKRHINRTSDGIYISKILSVLILKSNGVIWCFPSQNEFLYITTDLVPVLLFSWWKTCQCPAVTGCM